MSIQNWIYEHFNGKRYEVIGEAFDSETTEIMIIYKALYNSPEFWENALWVRPKDNFLEVLDISWKKVPRFHFISSL
jgi:hypothetical protein